MNWLIRPATAADLPQCAPIMVDALNDLSVRLGGAPTFTLATMAQPAWWAHLLMSSAGFWVAETVQGLVGFAVAVVREDEWFLSSLFVTPAAQSQGIGSALFAKCWQGAGGAAIRAVIANPANPVSVALYARHGMAPQVPLLRLSGPPPASAAPGDAGPAVTLVSSEDEDLSWLAPFDRGVRGHAHPDDHAYLRSAGHTLHRCIVEQTTVGYIYTAPWGQVGPAVAGPRSLTGAALAALQHLAAAGCPTAQLYVPGAASELVAWLLGAGFRNQGVDVYCADTLHGDWRCYLPYRPGLP